MFCNVVTTSSGVVWEEVRAQVIQGGVVAKHNAVIAEVLGAMQSVGVVACVDERWF